MRSKKSCSAAKSIFAIFVTLSLASIVVPAQTQTKFKVLHTFNGSDGAGPIGQLVSDKAGNLYGVAAIGGTGKCQSGCGTAFKMDSTGKMLWVHSFNGVNGNEPQAGLLRDAVGNLFGTTVDGGKVNNHICPSGCGVVFRLNAVGKETVLHKFTGPPDGYFPESLLAEDSAGNLYGVTYIGGDGGVGTVFKLDTAGREKILYNFTGGSDGCFPGPGVVLDSVGNLYGVASQGGNGFCNSGKGVVFEVDAAGNETVLHSFAGYPSDGAYPDSVLIFDSKGNLYGTTGGGGSSGVCDGGCGTVFELTPQDGSWSEAVLYNFCSLDDCADGEAPGGGPLVRNADGNLFGTTDFGGTHRNCDGDACGVVFKLDADDKETVLHSFTGGADGAFPWLDATDARGNLYGAAAQGGDLNCQTGNGQGCGTVFKITPGIN